MSLSPKPQDADRLKMIGLAECQRGNLAGGLDCFDRSLALHPDQSDVRYNRALILMNMGRAGDAIAGFEETLKAQPAFADAWLHRGNLLMDLDRLEDAVISFDRALALKPDHIEALTNRADALSNLKRFDEAIAGYGRVVTVQPDFAYAWVNQGVALMAAKRFPEALDSLDRALTLEPDVARTHCERAQVLQEMARNDEAIAACDLALRLQPDMAEAWNTRGNAELDLERYDDALASYDCALTINPDYAEALSNCGAALLKLNRHAEAVASCDRALAILPGVAEALNNRGTALLGLERFAEALADFDKALAINPLSATTFSNRGNALQGLLLFEDAVTAYDRALGIDSGHAEAQNHRGNAMQQMDHLEEAVACYERALELRPDYPWVPGQALHNRMHLSDWNGFHARLDDIVERLRRGERSATPFLLQSLIDAPDLHRLAAEAFAAERWPEKGDLGPVVSPPRHARMRIAYVSADFDEHPVTYLLAGMLERHDRTRFETYAISLRAGSGLWRDRVIGAVDHFIEVSGREDADVAAMLREREIDIAVDLNGFTKDCRTGIFALRAAPVQVSYIGFLGTMGAPYIDYLIADPVTVPPETQAHYAEKIAYLPSFQVNDDHQAASERSFTRAEAGLPDNGFVFSCFNLNYKITPDVFASWMRILQRVPDSVLWLYVKASAAVRNLKAEAERQGIDSARLIFAQRVPLADHQARQALAGLFLDTHPYNAGATASSALRAGVPVVTRLGQSFAARMGASLLHAAGLPELIVETSEAYENLAVELALDPVRLAALRRRLADNLSGCALFDTARSTRHVEAAYTAMYDRAYAGLAPDHIHVKETL
jgi:protein O-GlcNAc transferase